MTRRHKDAVVARHAAALKQMRSGRALYGQRTRSRYGYTPGNLYTVRLRDAVRHVSAGRVSEMTKKGMRPYRVHGRFLNWDGALLRAKALKPSTRAPYTVTFRENALEKHARARNPLRNVRNKAIRTRKGLKIGRFHVKYRYSGGTTKSPDTGIGWKDHRRLMESGEWLGRPE